MAGTPTGQIRTSPDRPDRPDRTGPLPDRSAMAEAGPSGASPEEEVKVVEPGPAAAKPATKPFSFTKCEPAKAWRAAM